MGPPIHPRSDGSVPTNMTTAVQLRTAATSWVSEWEQGERIVLWPETWDYMTDELIHYLGWRGWTVVEDFQRQFVRVRLSEIYDTADQSTRQPHRRVSIAESATDGPLHASLSDEDYDPEPIFLPGSEPHLSDTPSENMSDCDDDDEDEEGGMWEERNVMGVMWPVRVRRGGVPYAEFFRNPRDPLPERAQPGAPAEVVGREDVPVAVPVPVETEPEVEYEEPPSEMSEDEDPAHPPPMRDEDGVLYADIAQEGGERFERLLRSLGPEWDIPGYSDEEAEDEDEGGEEQQDDTERQRGMDEEEQEESGEEQEDGEEQQEEVMVRAGHTAQARRRSEGHFVLTANQLAQIYSDQQRSLREIVDNPSQADLISPATRRNVIRGLLETSILAFSPGANPNFVENNNMLIYHEPSLSWGDFERNINRIIDTLPPEIDQDVVYREIGPYLDFIERARTATRETAPRNTAGQRWGEQFVRQSPPGIAGDENEVDSDGEPMTTWTRTYPPIPEPYQPVETEGGVDRRPYAQEPRWNYSTTMQPTVSDIVRRIHAAQGKCNDNDDMFGLANSGYSSNRVQQYRLTHPVPGPSGTASTRMDGRVAPLRYRATLGRYATSREILFGMSNAADRFDDALQGFLNEVQGEGDSSSIPSTSTSCSSMKDKAREFVEGSRRTRESGRLRWESERESERERGRRSQPCGTPDNVSMGSISISRLPNKVNRLGDESADEGGALNNVRWLPTSQYEAVQAMRRMLSKEATGLRIFVPLRKGQGAKIEQECRYPWRDVCLNSDLNCAMYFVGTTVQRIILGTVSADGPQFQEVERAYSHATKSANEQLMAYMLDDTNDISEVKNLVDRGRGVNWCQFDSHTFGDDWLSKRELDDRTSHSQQFEDQKPLSLEPDIEFLEERFEEYVDLIKAFYKSTLDESLVIQFDHPYLDRIQRLAYGTRTGYWFRACLEGHARDMIKLCTRLKREEEAKKGSPEEKDLMDGFSIGSSDEATTRRSDGDRDSMDLAREAAELIASTADTNEQASRLWAGASAMLANSVPQ